MRAAGCGAYTAGQWGCGPTFVGQNLRANTPTTGVVRGTLTNHYDRLGNTRPMRTNIELALGVELDLIIILYNNNDDNNNNTM